METKFQTSFIPRRQAPNTPGIQSSAPRRSTGGGNMFMTVSAVVFVCSILAIGGAFLWKQYLVSEQEQYKHDLAVREQQFNIDLIKQLKAESTKIGFAKQLLTNHIATSKLFSVVEHLTAENVRFLSMDFTAPTDASGGAYQITLAGYGKDLTTVAFQAKVLNKMQDYGLRPVVWNPIVSNPSFNQNGSITFNVTAAVDPSILVYTAGAPVDISNATTSSQQQ